MISSLTWREESTLGWKENLKLRTTLPLCKITKSSLQRSANSETCLLVMATKIVTFPNVISQTGSKGGVWSTKNIRFRSQGDKGGQSGGITWATPFTKVWHRMDKPENYPFRVGGLKPVDRGPPVNHLPMTGGPRTGSCSADPCLSSQPASLRHPMWRDLVVQHHENIDLQRSRVKLSNGDHFEGGYHEAHNTHVDVNNLIPESWTSGKQSFPWEHFGQCQNTPNDERAFFPPGNVYSF